MMHKSETKMNLVMFSSVKQMGEEKTKKKEAITWLCINFNFAHLNLAILFYPGF